MKTLRLLLNIGVPDARRLNLDETLAGETVSVDDKVADELLRNHWATEVRPGDAHKAASKPATQPAAVPGMQPAAQPVPVVQPEKPAKDDKK